ncbi:hypothetical protein QBA54_01540 [Streptomyces sp. B21-108]|uniref:hypothetical protein n=1 Tax=Streptomyces sp. B21-108 TaxID=3039419 RepID=UPI002FF0341A
MTHRVATVGLDSELRYLEPENRKRYAALRKELEELVLGILQEGVTQGLFDVDHASDTARALLGMWQAVATWYHDGGPPRPACPRQDERGPGAQAPAAVAPRTPARIVSTSSSR